MKTAGIVIAAIIAMAFGGFWIERHFLAEDGSYWSARTTQFNSDKVGRLQAVGEDLRVYEFTPQSAPNKQCVFVAGTNKAGMTCFDKGNVK